MIRKHSKLTFFLAAKKYFYNTSEFKFMGNSLPPVIYNVISNARNFNAVTALIVISNI